MDFEKFVDNMTRHLYVYKFARAMDRNDVNDENASAQVRSARTRMRNARRRIEDDVLAFAAKTAHERWVKRWAPQRVDLTEVEKRMGVLFTHPRSSGRDVVRGTTTGRFVAVHPPYAELTPDDVHDTIIYKEESGTGGTINDD